MYNGQIFMGFAVMQITCFGSLNLPLLAADVYEHTISADLTTELVAEKQHFLDGKHVKVYKSKPI